MTMHKYLAAALPTYDQAGEFGTITPSTDPFVYRGSWVYTGQTMRRFRLPNGQRVHRIVKWCVVYSLQRLGTQITVSCEVDSQRYVSRKVSEAGFESRNSGRTPAQVARLMIDTMSVEAALASRVRTTPTLKQLLAKEA